MIISGKVTLKVADLNDSIHFYIFILGLTLKDRKGNVSASIVSGNLKLFLEQQFYRGPDKKPNSSGASLGLVVSHLDPVLLKLSGSNIPVKMHETEDGRMFTFLDPDSNKIFVREIGQKIV